MKKLSFIFTISTLLINSTMATTPAKFIPSNINPDLYNPYPCVVFKHASEHPAICGYKSVSGRMREYRIFSYTGKIFEMLVADAVDLKDRLRESQIETGVF